MIEFVIYREDKQPEIKTLHSREVILGRSAISELRFTERFVSNRHARFFFQDKKLFYKDLMSSNGSRVIKSDGETIHLQGPVRDPVQIEKGDKVIVGNIQIMVETVSDDEEQLEWTMTGRIQTGGVETIVDEEELKTTFAVLHRFTLHAFTAKEPKEVLDNLALAAFALFSPVSQMEFISAGEELTVEYAWNGNGNPVDPSKIKIGESVVREAIRRKEGYILSAGEGAAVIDLTQTSSASAMAVPLWLDQVPWGVFIVKRQIPMNPFVMNDLRTMTMFTYHASTAAWRIDLTRELDEAFESTIRSLLAALDMRDPTTSVHSLKVQALAMRIADEMKLPESSKRIIRYASLLHDVGKLGISDEILNKKGPLTKEEQEKMAQHARFTLDLLSRIKFPKYLVLVPEIASMHHEHLDGKGPLQVKAEEIPLEARILAVADVFEALTAARPYKELIRATDVHLLMDQMAKGHLDHEVIDALVRSLSL